MRSRNLAPKYTILNNITLCQDTGVATLFDFAHILSAGAPHESGQHMTFSLDSVECIFECTLPPPPAEADVFIMFDLLQNGTLLMQTQPGYSGVFRVTIALSDDGGTAFGGIDKSLQSFLLILLPTIDSMQRTSNELRLTSDGTRQTSHNFSAFSEGHSVLPIRYMLSDIQSDDGFFASHPEVDIAGIVHFTSAADAAGLAKLVVHRWIADTSLAGSGDQSSAEKCSPMLGESTLTIHSTPVLGHSINMSPALLSFEIPESYAVVEGEGYQSVANFASEITINSAASTAVVFLTSFTSSQTHLFEMDPHINSHGTLEFSAATHGKATVQVELKLAGSVGEELRSYKQFTLTVYPLPRISSVTPQIVPLEGGVRLTVRGKFFGSQYSRGYSAPAYGNFSIYVGNTRCTDEVYIADTVATCLVSGGVGSSSVNFNISDGGYSRSGSLSEAVVHTLVVYAGASTDAEMAGFLGFGPKGAAVGSYDRPGASVADAKLNISRAVLAVTKYDGKVIAGGNFKVAAGKELGHVLAWDGLHVQRIGRGLDGVVESLTVYRGLLVVGGQFSRALNADGSSLGSGGLVGWTGRSWTSIGDAEVQGIVTTCFAVNSKLYIAGRFRNVGVMGAGGLAVFNGTMWDTVGPDASVSGGLITTMAAMHGDLYVGGTFTHIGGATCARFARYDGRRWSAQGSFDGAVRAIAIDGESILVGGDFTQVDGVEVSNIARYHSGKWTSLARGLDGTVFSIQTIGSCVYIGGTFTNSISADGKGLIPTRHVTRWCTPNDDDDLSEQNFESFESFDSLGPVQVILPFF